VRFLADCGISPQTVEFLREGGHDVGHVRELGMARASDREIVARAIADASIILTFDLDFGEILALGVLDKPSVVICRLTDERPDSVNARLSIVLQQRAAILEAGALITIEDTRYRVRKLPVGRSSGDSTARDISPF
jgi:predicted nuclease of predicted toxin-antitoxin system